MRIVSVVPSITELLYDLGLSDDVVGITKFCVHPRAWFDTKTRVGGTKQLHLDTIRYLEPDLVICNKEENVKAQIDALRDYTEVVVTDVQTIADALKLVTLIGKHCHRQANAEQLHQQLTQSYTNIKQLYTGSVAYLIWKGPYMTVGSDTYIHQMLTHLGFANVFADKTRYPTISLADIQQVEPDYVFLSSEPYPFKQHHCDEIIKVVDSKVILVDGEAFSWYGSRLLQTVKYLSQFTVQFK